LRSPRASLLRSRQSREWAADSSCWQSWSTSSSPRWRFRFMDNPDRLERNQSGVVEGQHRLERCVAPLHTARSHRLSGPCGRRPDSSRGRAAPHWRVRSCDSVEARDCHAPRHNAIPSKRIRRHGSCTGLCQHSNWRDRPDDCAVLPERVARAPRIHSDVRHSPNHRPRHKGGHHCV
jgi:hypothetical protein